MILCHRTYLYYVRAERFSRLLNQRKIYGISLERGGPTLNHLFFANDFFVFYSINTQSAIKISKLLKTYKLCSGEKVNFEKSIILFSKNTSEQEKNDIITEISEIQGITWGCI